MGRLCPIIVLISEMTIEIVDLVEKGIYMIDIDSLGFKQAPKSGLDFSS